MTCLNIALIIFLAATSGGVIGIKSWNLDLEKGQIVVEKCASDPKLLCLSNSEWGTVKRDTRTQVTSIANISVSIII